MGYYRAYNDLLSVFACIVGLQTVLITENCGMYTEYAP